MSAAAVAGLLADMGVHVIQAEMQVTVPVAHLYYDEHDQTGWMQQTGSPTSEAIITLCGPVDVVVDLVSAVQS